MPEILKNALTEKENTATLNKYIIVLLAIFMTLVFVNAEDIKPSQLPTSVKTSITKLFADKFAYDKIKKRDKRGVLYTITGEFDDTEFDIVFNKDGDVIKVKSNLISEDKSEEK